MLVLALALMIGSQATGQAQQKGRLTALFAERGPDGRGVRLSWALARGAEGSTLELSRDGVVIWKGVSDHFVDDGAAAGEHVYRLSGAGTAREVAVVSEGGACAGAPNVTLEDPTIRWMGLGTVAAVRVAGSVAQPAGCGAVTLSFRVLGPDGFVRSGDLPAPRDGRFEGALYLDAAPGDGFKGKEQDYRVEVDAVNERGMAGSAPRSVRVPARTPEAAN